MVTCCSALAESDIAISIAIKNSCFFIDLILFYSIYALIFKLVTKLHFFVEITASSGRKV